MKKTLGTCQRWIRKWEWSEKDIAIASKGVLLGSYVWVSVRLQLNIRFSEGTFEVFGTSPAFSTPHENREFTEERAGGLEFLILRGCLLDCLGRFRLLFPLLARIENL